MYERSDFVVTDEERFAPSWMAAVARGVRERSLGLALLGIFLALAVGYHLYRATGIPVTINVDGHTLEVRTHRRTVGDLLQEMGLTAPGARPRPEDVVLPGPDAILSSGQLVIVQRARPVQLTIGGDTRRFYTRGQTLEEIFAGAGVYLSPYDEVEVDGRLATDIQAPLSFPAASPPPLVGRARYSWAERPAPALRIRVRRAIDVQVTDDSGPYVLHTTAATVGEALLREGVVLYLGDQVRPGLGARIVPGLHVYITRSVPFSIRVDGREIRTRSRQRSVADALAELGIVVAAADLVEPALTDPLRPNLAISITRVREEVEVEQEAIPYEVVWKPDDDLAIDERRIDVAGQEGITRRRLRVTYHDGQPIQRVLEDEWTAQEPITQVIAYGRKIVLHTLETPQGPITYWRKVRMLATSYSPSTAGVSPSDPYFGRTRTGQPLRTGIVAVDPFVVRLGTRVYVPGYGVGEAADTGSLIRGRRIDLGYSDDELVLWYRWVDVYLLAPPPPAYQIRWILPDTPRERRR